MNSEELLEAHGNGTFTQGTTEKVQKLLRFLRHLPKKTWYVYEHKNLKTLVDINNVIGAMKQDGLKSPIIFQQNTTAFILHQCELPSAIKCRCRHYNKLVPSVTRLYKQNLNMLTGASGVFMIREILQVLLEFHFKPKPYQYGINLAKFNGIRYTVQNVMKVTRILKNMTGTEITIHCGLAVKQIMLPNNDIIRPSQVQANQFANSRTIDNMNAADVLNGTAFQEEETINVLSAPISELTAGIVKVFEKYMPTPTESILSHDVWLNSVLCDLDESSLDYMKAKTIYERKFQRMGIPKYLEYLADAEDGINFCFRSDGQTIFYQTAADSLANLKRWLRFQFGRAWTQFVQDVFDWLTRKEQKRGGFEVVGPPNSGKSYFMGALMDLFNMVGTIRPNPGYTFNFDDCIGKQAISSDEFYLNPSDKFSVETLKDALGGNSAKVKDKGKKPDVIKPIPWLFMSKYPNFDFSSAVDNTWPSRFYHYEVNTFPDWQPYNRKIFCHPYVWILLFKQFKFI